MWRAEAGQESKIPTRRQEGAARPGKKYNNRRAGMACREAQVKAQRRRRSAERALREDRVARPMQVGPILIQKQKQTTLIGTVSGDFSFSG